jgi:transposase
MRNTELNLHRIADQFGVSHSAISRLLKCHREARTVKERDRSGRPRKTSPRDDRALSQSARRCPFSTARRLCDNWAIHGHVSVRTVNRRLNCARLKARRIQHIGNNTY